MTAARPLNLPEYIPHLDLWAWSVPGDAGVEHTEAEALDAMKRAQGTKGCSHDDRR